MRSLRPVLKSTKGEYIICLEVVEGSKEIETLVCLGRRGNVKLPLSEWVKSKIEERFGGYIDWGDVERGIRDIVS